MTKFREYITSDGSLVYAGKDAKNNEEIIAQVKLEEEVFHTAEVGSPFVNIKEKPTKKAIKEAATFCAAYSKDWKTNHGSVVVHQFKGKDIYKEKNMKLGTFGVRKYKTITISKKEIQEFLDKIKKCQ
jgi:predicted ribosome quality control (RQC) complex YloA/Tae2 family protein